MMHFEVWGTDGQGQSCHSQVLKPVYIHHVIEFPYSSLQTPEEDFYLDFTDPEFEPKISILKLHLPSDLCPLDASPSELVHWVASCFCQNYCWEGPCVGSHPP